MKKVILSGLALVLLSFCNNKSGITDSEKISFLLKSDDSLSVTLKYHQSILINDNLEINFDDVPVDSRCPLNVYCFWAGDAEVKLNFFQNDVKLGTSLHTTLDPKSITIWNYNIKLVSLTPYPEAGKELKKEDYVVELLVKFN